MRRPKRKNIGSKAPATKGDIEQLREDIHADMVEHMVSKQTFESRMGRVDKRLGAIDQRLDGMDKRFDGIDKRFDGIDKRFDGIEDRIVNRVVKIIEARDEQREAELKEIYDDQLDIVAGKKEAPPQWKTVPRRLKTVEREVENIKDHLAIVKSGDDKISHPKACLNFSQGSGPRPIWPRKS